MRARLFAVWSAVMAGGLILLFFFCNDAVSQARFNLLAQSPSGREQGPDKTKKKKESKTLDVVNDEPEPPTKPGGRRRTRTNVRPQREQRPEIIYTVFAREKDNSSQAVSRYTTFYDGDAYRLVIKPNMDGYLFVIKQSVARQQKPDSEYTLIFPGTRTSGQNFLKKGQEYSIPCGEQKDECWWRVKSPAQGKEAGREEFIVVFSLEDDFDLLNTLRPGGESNKTIIKALTDQAGEQRASKPDPGKDNVSPFSMAVTGSAPGSNRKVVALININHQPVTKAEETSSTPPPVAPKPPPKPPLEITSRVDKRNNDGSSSLVDPNTLSGDDRYRLVLKPNKSGYMYVIQQSQKGESKVLFPGPRASSAVEKDREYLIMRCTKLEDKNCWLRMDTSAGAEMITVIFSVNQSTSTAEEYVKTFEVGTKK